MNAIISILMGAIITVIALLYLRNEIKKVLVEKNSVLNSIDQGKMNHLITYITDLEKQLDEVNESFYEITNDLEGKFSVHEKEIELLNQELDGLKAKYKTIVDLSKKIPNIQAKVEKKSLKSEKQDIINSGKQENGQLHTEPASEKSVKFQDLTTREKIVFLRSEGYEIQQIAKKLNIGIGEIKLILNMRE